MNKNCEMETQNMKVPKDTASQKWWTLISHTVLRWLATLRFSSKTGCEKLSLQLLKSADEFDITNMVSEPSRAFID